MLFCRQCLDRGHIHARSRGLSCGKYNWLEIPLRIVGGHCGYQRAILLALPRDTLVLGWGYCHGILPCLPERNRSERLRRLSRADLASACPDQLIHISPASHALRFLLSFKSRTGTSVSLMSGLWPYHTFSPYAVTHTRICTREEMLQLVTLFFTNLWFFCQANHLSL